MPLTKSGAKELARYLYFHTAASQKQIAQAVFVTEKTLYNWMRRGNWATLKKATFYSPDQETHYLYEELRAINNKIQARDEENRHGTREELEAKAKIISMITSLKKNADDKWRNPAPDFEMPDFNSRQPEEYVIVFKDRDGTYYLDPSCNERKKNGKEPETNR